MKYLNLALRNLSRQKRRSALLAGAIAIGVMIVTLVGGFSAGAVKNIKGNFSYLMAGEVYLSEQNKRADGETISEIRDDGVLLEVLHGLGVSDDSMVKRSSMQATLMFNGIQSTQTVQGVDWAAEPQLLERLQLVEGSVEDAASDPRGLIISMSVAKKLKVELGEEVTARTSTVTGQQNAGSFVVRAIMTDPGFLGSISSYANRQRVNEMINLGPDSYQSLNISLGRFESIDAFTDQLYAKLGEVAAVAPRVEREDINVSSFQLTYESKPRENWMGSRYHVDNINDFTSQFEQMAGIMTMVSYVVLVVLFIIIMVGIINTFRMIMLERVREIGTMRAVGIQRPDVLKLFLWEAAGIAGLGYLGGLVLAVIGSIPLRLIRVPADNPFNLFTSGGHLSFPFGIIGLIVTFVLVTGLTLIAASFPAGKAAKARPADALRSI